MHDLRAMYDRSRDILLCLAGDRFDHLGSTRFYPNPPETPDLDIVALAVAAEWLEIDSENLLYARLRSTYPDLLATLPHRVNFNRRRKRPAGLTQHCLRVVAAAIDDDSERLLVDSMPVPTANVRRERWSKACRRPGVDRVLADKTYHVASARYLLGYKLHLITSSSGVYVDHAPLSASEHDLRYLKDLSQAVDDDLVEAITLGRLLGRQTLGDKGYLSKPFQLTLVEQLDLDLQTPMHSNQKDWKPYRWDFTLARKGIETTFPQLCDETRVKCNRAKRYLGVETRVVTKLLAHTIRQLINVWTGYPINQTKHALDR